MIIKYNNSLVFLDKDDDYLSCSFSNYDNYFLRCERDANKYHIFIYFYDDLNADIMSCIDTDYFFKEFYFRKCGGQRYRIKLDNQVKQYGKLIEKIILNHHFSKNNN